MNIVDLEKILLKPEKKCSALSEEEWGNVENKLGIVLPYGYKELVNNYGIGCIDKFLWIYTPYAKNEYLDLLKQIEVINNAYLEMKEEFPEDYTFDIFPKKGGLLPFGGTENGDVLYWLTGEDDTSWSIVVYDSRHSEYIEYNKSILDFLYELLTKKIVCNIFPSGFPSKTIRYYPIDEL